MPPALDGQSRTRQRIHKPPPTLAVPDIQEDATERRRVLNVLAQRRYRQRKRESRIQAQPSREISAQLSTPTGDERLSQGVTFGQPAGNVDDDFIFLPSDCEALNHDLMPPDDAQGEQLELLQWLCNPDSSLIGITPPPTNDPMTQSPVLKDVTCTTTELGALSFSTSSTNSTASITPPESSNIASPRTGSFPDSYLLAVPPLTLLRAVLRIAARLNAASSVWSMTSTSPFNLGLGPPSTELPPTWQPTPNQILVPHHPVVDLLPWPAVRDRIIDVMSLGHDGPNGGSAGSLGLVDFIYDMEDGAEGLRIWGADPFDEANWEVGQVVFERWWFVFDRRVVERSNYWRRQRGAAPLRIGA